MCVFGEGGLSECFFGFGEGREEWTTSYELPYHQ